MSSSAARSSRPGKTAAPTVAAPTTPTKKVKIGAPIVRTPAPDGTTSYSETLRRVPTSVKVLRGASEFRQYCVDVAAGKAKRAAQVIVQGYILKITNLTSATGCCYYLGDMVMGSISNDVRSKRATYFRISTKQ
jgi:hypothetical protein